jgi:hypothetical protein
MKNLRQYLINQHDMLDSRGELFRDRNQRSRLLLTGDKGGHSTKLAVVFIQNHSVQSSKNVHVIAQYQAEHVGEDYECIQRVMQPLMEDVGEWALEHNVDVYLGGDMKWLWTLHGMSSNGKYPCLYCTYQRKSNNGADAQDADYAQADDSDADKSDGHSSDSECPHINEIKQRTYKFHMKNFTKLGGEKHETAKSVYNCIREPILPPSLAFKNIVPMPLHVFLGIGSLFLNRIKRFCKELDDKFNAYGLNIAYNDTEIKEKKESQLIATFQDIANYFEGKIRNANTDSDYAVRSYKLNYEHALNQIAKKARVIKVLAAQKIKLASPFTTTYESFFKGLKVNQRGGMGDQLVGAELGRLVEDQNKAALYEIMDGVIYMNTLSNENSMSDEDRERRSFDFGIKEEFVNFRSAFDAFALLFQDSLSTQPWTDEKLHNFQVRLSTFGDLFSAAKVHPTVTPKLHVLLRHMLPFVTTHMTLGAVSEQSIESTHAVMNQMERRYAGVKGNSHRLELQIKAVAIRSDAKIQEVQAKFVRHRDKSRREKKSRKKRNCTVPLGERLPNDE